MPFTGLSSPEGVAVDQEGDVFTTSGDTVLELYGGGEQQTLPFAGLNGPEGVAVDSAGDVFTTSGNSVVELPAGGAQQTLPLTGLDDPSGVAVDSAGDVFVADTGNNRIVELSPLSPTVSTSAATEVSESTATLNGQVNANGEDTTYQFELSADPAFGSFTALAPQDAGAGTQSVEVSASASALTPGSLYYYRLVASSATGTTTSSPAQAFTTGLPTLLVALAGSGTGAVTGSGIRCPGSCVTTAGPGTMISLTATAGSGSTFAGWSGANCSGTEVCTVRLFSDQDVTATFTLTCATGSACTTPRPRAGAVAISCADASKCLVSRSGGAVEVTVSCAKGSAGCSGTATITIPGASAEPAARSTRRKARTPRVIKLGELRFLLMAGKKKTLTIRVDSIARRLLTAHHNRLRADLTIATGLEKTVRIITLTIPPKRPARRHGAPN